MQSRLPFLCAISLLSALTGCGGGASSSATTRSGDFTLAIAPCFDYDYSRRCCADCYAYRFSGERLQWQCELGRRLLTKRCYGYTDDPVDSSRRAAAD